VKSGSIYNLLNPDDTRTIHQTIMGVSAFGQEPQDIKSPQVLSIPWNNGPLTISSIYTAQSSLPVPTLIYPRMGSL